MKRYINRNENNLLTMKSIVKIANSISRENNNNGIIHIDINYSLFIKIIMLSREIYVKWLNDFVTVVRMAEFYEVDLNSLNRILSIGKYSSKNHNYILKNYR